MADLEERLRNHSSAFDGLLSLIPAKNYYAPKDGDVQWNKRKQSKSESVRAKKAKLDPDALVTAVEVRDNGGLESDSADSEGEDDDEYGDEEMTDADAYESEEDSDVVEGGEGMDVELGGDDGPESDNEEDYEDVTDDEEEGDEKVPQGKGRGKQDNKDKEHQAPSKPDTKDKNSTSKLTKSEKKKLKRTKQLEEQNAQKTKKDSIKETKASKFDNGEAMEIDSGMSLPGIADNGIVDQNSSTSTSPALSSTTAATTPPSTTSESQPSKSDSIIDIRARLAVRIEALRAARKAVGTSSANTEGPDPPRNRQELMEARAKKEALRKAKKAEARKAAQEAARAAASLPPTNGIVASSSRGTSVDGHASPAPMSSNYSFGKVVFDDGDALDASLRSIATGKKRARGGDAKALLEQVQKKKVRLEGMDAEKRERVEESDRWGKALSKVAGEKVRDDEKLLKKTVKREEGKKRKSEREWSERKDSVEKSKAMKQKKREENIAKRKEQKKAGKSGKKVPKKGGKVKMKGNNKKGNNRSGGSGGGSSGRPGFEGGLGSRAKAGGSKGKK